MNSSESTKEEREKFIEKLEKEATDQGMSLPEYMAVTGGDAIRDIMQRMIKAELEIRSR